MEKWQDVMQSGNQHYKESAWIDAQYCYQLAVSMIETQWSTEEGDRQLLFAWIAGMHNLAHLHERQQQSEMALHFLKNAHEKVLQMSSDNALSDHIRSSAFQSLSLTIPALLDFAKRHPICDSCVDALEQSAERIGAGTAQLH